MRIFNATRHPRHVEAAAIDMYMYLYSLAFMDHPCTLGAAVCHQAPPCPLYTQPRARRVWVRRTNGLKIVLPSLIFVLLRLLIAPKMVSAFADTTFTFGTDPTINLEMTLRWTINVRPMEGEDTKQSQCEYHGYQKYSWWLKFNVFRQYIWRHFQHRYHQTVNEKKKQKKKKKKKQKNSPPSKLVKMFYSLEICHLLECVNHRINCTDQGQWPLNTTADCGGFPYWFSVTYWLAEWHCSMEYLVFNWFVQMKYL